MLSESHKTGACRRFFCAGIPVLLWGLCLVLVPSSAQIALPDAPEQEQEELEPSLPVIEGKPAEEELQNMIRELQGHQSPHSNFAEDAMPPPTDISLLENQERIYETAPEILKVSCELFSGERRWGEMSNRSFQVRNIAGNFPVILHQLESIKAGDQEGVFIFHFSGGDHLKGNPALELLYLRLPEGGDRVFRLSELKSMEVVGKEP